MARLFSLGSSAPPGVDYLIEQGLLSPAPEADQYTWESFARDEELVTTSSSVVWTQGGSVKRLLRFPQEEQSIVQATLTWFDVDRSDQLPPIGSAPAGKVSQRALVVVLTEQAHVFFLDGSSHVVHLPCEAEQVFPTPKGVLLRRKTAGTEALGHGSQSVPSAPPNSFLSPSGVHHRPSSVFSPSLGHQQPVRLATRRKSTPRSLSDFSIEVSADPVEDLPLYLTLTDPLVPIGLAVESLGPAQYTPSPYHNRTTSLETVALGHEEQLLYVSPSDELGVVASLSSASTRPLILSLTYNKVTDSYNVWYCSFQQTKSIISWKRQQAEASNRADQSARKAQLLFHSGALQSQGNARDSFGRPIGDSHVFPGSHSKPRRSEKLQVEKTRKSEAAKPNLESPEKAKAANRRTSSKLARTELGSQTAAASFEWGHHGHAPGHAHRTSNRMPSFGRAQPDRRSFRASQASARASFAGMPDIDGDLSMQDDLEAKYTGYEDFLDLDLQDPFDDTRRDLMLLKVATFSEGAAVIGKAAAAMKIVPLVNGKNTELHADNGFHMRWLLLDKDSGVLTELRLPLDNVIRIRGQDDLIAPRMNHIEARKIPDVADMAAIFDGTERRVMILPKGPQTHLILYPGTRDVRQADNNPCLFQDTEKVAIPSASTDASTTLLKVHIHGQSQKQDKITAPSPESSLDYQRISSYLKAFDGIGRYRLLKAVLQPANSHVRRAIEVCGHLMPASCGGRFTMLHLYWNDRSRKENSEWQKLMVALIMLFVPFLGSDGTMFNDTATSQTNATHESKLDGTNGRRLWEILASDDQLLTDLKAAVQEAEEAALNDPRKLFPLGETSNEAWESFFSRLLPTLHLVRQEEMLNAASPDNSQDLHPPLLSTLAQLGTWLGWREWGHESDWYLKASIRQHQSPPFDTRQLQGLACHPPPFSPPDIIEWFVQRTHGSEPSFPRLHDILLEADNTLPALGDKLPYCGRFVDLDKRYTPRLMTVIEHVSSISRGTSGSSGPVIEESPDRRMKAMLQMLPDPLSAMLRTQLEFKSQAGRDFVLSSRGESWQLHGKPAAAHLPRPTPGPDSLTVAELGAVSAACIAPSRNELTDSAQVMFSQNTTYQEGLRLLSSHIHPSGVLHSKPGDSESKFLEAERAHAQLIGIRSTAVTTGTALMDFQQTCPLPTQELEIGLWETQIKMLPSGHTMTLSRENFTEPKSAWAAYHTGVAAGLSVVRGISAIDHSWICLNKPQEPNNRHAGLLLGLGLNGYLSTMPRWLVFKYLTTKHEMTSISLLIGLAASHLGTMNTLVVKVLSIHLVSLLPAEAAELNLSSLVQTAGTMGAGLLYCNTHHRRMSEVMLSELEIEDKEDKSDPSSKFIRDEGYRLSAGFALGLINLGQGNNLRTLYGMDVEQRLLAAATGPKDVHSANFTDHAMAGSIMALALIYMKSENKPLAIKIGCPPTRPRFDYIRPDVLMLRVLACNMIMWNDIEASDEWILRNLPTDLQEDVVGMTEPSQRAQALTGRVFSKGRVSRQERLQTTRLHQYSIVAGLLWSIGLKYAGTGDIAARDFILMYYDAMNVLEDTATASYDKRLVYVALLRLQHLLLLAAATIMSGTGDLHVLRRARMLHGTVNEHSTYGLHQASHMVIGALFLGQGRYAFGTSNLAIASLMCAFYQLFPKDIMDNKAHLQAFRHLWVLAAEPRALVVRDEETGSVVNVPVNVILNDGTSRSLKTPALLQPSLEAISKVEVISTEHWPAVIDFHNEQDVKKYRSTQVLLVRKRTLLAQYENDPYEVSVAIKRLDSLNTSTNVHTSSGLADWVFESAAFSKMGVSRADLHSTLPRNSPNDEVANTRHTNDRLSKLKRDLGERKRKVEHELLKTMPALAQHYAPSLQQDAETKHEGLDLAEEQLPPIESLLDIGTTKMDDISSIWGSAKSQERPQELNALFDMSSEARDGSVSQDFVNALKAEVTRQDSALDDWVDTLIEGVANHAPPPSFSPPRSSSKADGDAQYESVFAGLALGKDDDHDPMDVDGDKGTDHYQCEDVSEEEWVR